MSAHFKRIALPTTLTDLLDARNVALRNITDAARILDKVERNLSSVGHYLTPRGAHLREPLSSVERELDRRFWRRAFDMTGFRQLMDADAVDDFDRDLERDPPGFTEENIRSTFASLFQEKDAMFRRGVVNVFRRLPDIYKTNSWEPFRIGNKLVLEFVAEERLGGRQGVRIGNRASERLDDIARVFLTLDGAEFKPRALEAAINRAWSQGEDYNSEYFTIRGYKNGNAHMWIKRTDLLDRVNELIAEYYGDGALA